jgi:hypothetical protein
MIRGNVKKLKKITAAGALLQINNFLISSKNIQHISRCRLLFRKPPVIKFHFCGYLIVYYERYTSLTL